MPHCWGEYQGACQFCYCFKQSKFRYLLPYESWLLFPRARWIKVRCSNAGIAENPWTLNAREFRPGFTFRTCSIFWSTEASKHVWWPGLTHVKMRALMVFLPYFSLFDLSHLLWILNIFKHSSIYLDCLNVATDFYTFESGRVDPESTIAIQYSNRSYLFRTLLQFRAHACKWICNW